MGNISLQMYTVREHTKTIEDLEKTLDRLCDIGFNTLQYTIPDSYNVKTIAKLFDERNLKNDSVFCHCMQIEERLPKIIEQCEIFDTKYVRTGTIPVSLATDASGFKMFAHYLNEVCAELKKHGIKMLYHFHAFEFVRFGEETGIDIFLKETDPEVIQLIPDTHWIHSGGVSVPEFLEKNKDRYDYVHMKDFGIEGRQAHLEAHPIVYAPVGEGNLNWEPIVEVCKKNNVLSYAIEQDSCYEKDPFECVTSSFNYLKKLGVDK